MKTIWLLFVNRYAQLFTITKLTFAIIAIAFMACNRPAPTGYNANLDLQQEQEDSIQQEYISSVSFANGKYKIDTSVIQKDRNKKRLLKRLETEVLAEKQNTSEIPGFIKAFLDSISHNRKFDVANPGEEWQIGITNFGKQVINKIYDPSKKDSVIKVFWDGQQLPTKQLVYFGIGEDIALISYFCGGIRLTQYAAIIKFENNTITDFWYGNIFEFATTKKETIKNIRLSGKRNDRC